MQIQIKGWDDIHCLTFNHWTRTCIVNVHRGRGKKIRRRYVLTTHRILLSVV